MSKIWLSIVGIGIIIMAFGAYALYGMDSNGANIGAFVMLYVAGPLDIVVGLIGYRMETRARQFEAATDAPED